MKHEPRQVVPPRGYVEPDLRIALVPFVDFRDGDACRIKDGRVGGGQSDRAADQAHVVVELRAVRIPRRRPASKAEVLLRWYGLFDGPLSSKRSSYSQPLRRNN
jgi:hypothetical protein